MDCFELLDPLTADGCEDDIISWPLLNRGKNLHCIISKKAFEADCVGQKLFCCPSPLSETEALTGVFGSKGAWPKKGLEQESMNRNFESLGTHEFFKEII